MPRITADSVAEHVAQQEAAVFDAALRLFIERGYSEVTLADIAAEVGLARNSLYRYFPDKAHILVRWLRQELPREAARSRERLTGSEPALELIKAWAIDQLDYARRPEHRLLADLPQVARHLDDATRAELADSHRRLMAPMGEALARAGLEEHAERSAVIDLIGAMVLAAANREAQTGTDPVLRARLLNGLDGLVSGPG